MFERTMNTGGGIEALESRRMLSVKVSDLALDVGDFVEYLGNTPSAGVVMSAGGSLHRMNPSTGTTTAFFSPASEGLQLEFIDDFTFNLGNRAIFTALDADGGTQLWATDGTRPGTRMLRTFTPTEHGVNFIAQRASRIYFAADDGQSGSELWATDGTPAGTVMIKDINPDGGSLPEAFIDYDPWLPNSVPIMFIAETQGNGRELWVTDGTAGGTRMVKDINPFGESMINGFGAVGSRAYFSADDGEHGSELWVTDGTSAGTFMVKDIAPGPADPGLGHFGDASVNGKFLFTVGEGEALWASDGTSAGTIELTSESAKGVLGIVNGKMLFATPGGLWSTGGTPQSTASFFADTTMGGYVLGLNPWRFDLKSRPSLYFSTTSGFDPLESSTTHAVWKTNGTAAGTVRLVSVETTSGGFGFTNTFARDTSNRLYFSMPDGKLRRTDGTVAGTTVLETNFAEPISLTSQSLIYFGSSSGDDTSFDGIWRLSGSFDQTLLNDVTGDIGGSGGGGGGGGASPPSVSAITASAERLTRGGTVSLTATAAAASGRTVRTVEWYEDTNRNGAFDSGVDKKVGQSTPSSTGVARYDVKTLKLSAGVNRYFARAKDNANAFSTAGTGVFELDNAAPTMTGVKASTTFLKKSADRITVSGQGAKDADGKIASISFHIDSNGDGVFNAEVDQVIGTTPAGRPTSSVTVPAALLRPGDNRVFGVCRDNDGASSGVVSTVVRLNRPPTIQGVTFTPASGSRLTTSFDFAAAGVADIDNGIKSVEFWIDSNNNGVLDRSDRKLGAGKLLGDSWRLTIKPKTLAIGEFRIIGAVTDRSGEITSLLTQDRLTVVG